MLYHIIKRHEVKFKYMKIWGILSWFLLLLNNKLISFLSWSSILSVTPPIQDHLTTPLLKLSHIRGPTDTARCWQKEIADISRAQAFYLLFPAGLGSGSLLSTFFPGASFSALSSKALRATLLKTFPWASLINWTSWRMSQYSPF